MIIQVYDDECETWYLGCTTKYGTTIDVDPEIYSNWKWVEKAYANMQKEIREHISDQTGDKKMQEKVEEEKKGRKFDNFCQYDRDEILRTYPDAAKGDGYIYKENIVGFRNKYLVWEREKE